MVRFEFCIVAKLQFIVPINMYYFPSFIYIFVIKKNNIKTTTTTSFSEQLTNVGFWGFVQYKPAYHNPEKKIN